MENPNSQYEMLDLLLCPAFCVKDGVIVKVNPAAQQRMLRPDCQVRDLIETGAEEYAAFSGGCLFLTLQFCGCTYPTTVTDVNGLHVFCLETENTDRELRAMALAALELRRSLSGITTVVDRLMRSIHQLGQPELSTNAAELNRSLFQTLRMINNMSDAARYQNGCATPLTTQDICAVLDEIFARAAELASHAGIQIQFTNLDTPVYCLVDMERLERGIFNIISNAMKFTPAGGTIRAELNRNGNRLYLHIQDSGCGIAPGLKGSIYTQYLREPSIEDSRSGIGLGMMLIRAAAEAHGGTVLIDQPDGCGTRVTLTLEIRKAAPNQFRSPALTFDYAGELDHALMELSDALPLAAYRVDTVN